MSDYGQDSRLDKKIAEGKLLANIEPLWDDLYAATEATREKLRIAYGRESTEILNDHNSIIRITCSMRPDHQVISVESTLEMRLDRDAKKLKVVIRRKYSSGGNIEAGSPKDYEIAADLDNQLLYFTRGANSYTATGLAEHLIVERLMEIKL